MAQTLKQLQDLLEGAPKDVADPGFPEAVVGVAELLLTISNDTGRLFENQRKKQLASLMSDRSGQLFTTLLTDRIPRLDAGSDRVAQARHVLNLTGVPGSFGPVDTVLLRALKWFGWCAPGPVGHLIQLKIVKEAEHFLLRGGRESLERALKDHGAEGIRVNVNRLGEEVLGHDEAEKHLNMYLKLLELPGLETISIKVSSICAQLSTLDMEVSVARVCEALRRLYRSAQEQTKKGNSKLLMLDMEAFRDLELTHRAFREVLGEDEFLSLRAGIVLQAYLPDTHGVMVDLMEFAEERMERGGAPLQVRLVKGANLAAERVEASQRGWANPIYSSKAEVDGSFRRLTIQALGQRAQRCFRVGIATHNLFDVALGLLLAREAEGGEGVHFEVLSGMAGPLSRCLKSLGHDVLVYCPSVANDALHVAVAYLVRRMDENTGEDNYLRHSFEMEPGDVAWRKQITAFEEGWTWVNRVSTVSRRLQRTFESVDCREGFVNEPDTDFITPQNRHWLRDSLEAASSKEIECLGTSIPPGARKEYLDGFDPSRPGVVPYQYETLPPAGIEEILRRAVGDLQPTTSDWETRYEVLRKCASVLARKRPELIGALVLDGGKQVENADAEVSEAVDFANYYAESLRQWSSRQDIGFSPRGVTVVVSPWNFPLAIPLGGVFASYAMGNKTILKPSNEAPLAAVKALAYLHGEGLLTDEVDLVMASDEVATQLIVDERVDTVVLTGGTDTARKFLEWRPSLHLLAETGGKNAMIITRKADLDHAIQSIVASAFGHAGQKCSAASLLILTEGVYRDLHFRKQLIDAVESLHVGEAWDLGSVVTPLIGPPQGHFAQALEHIEPGETWWVKPRCISSDRRLWTPGVKAGVLRGATSHQTEFFGPLLSVMQAPSLEDAIELANDTPYGLTAGLHSLDEREQEVFIEKMNAGNLYVNRTTTGAIVARQPFGGRKASCFGPGAKAGGPNYITQFGVAKDVAVVSGATNLFNHVPRIVLDVMPGLERFAGEGEMSNLHCAVASYAEAFVEHFGVTHEFVSVRGEDNMFRYQVVNAVAVIVGKYANRIDVARLVIAGLVTGANFRVYICPEHGSWRDILEANLGPARVGRLHDLDTGKYERFRCVGLGTNRRDQLRQETPAEVRIDSEAPLNCGRIELMKWCQEQSVSVEFHRYGNLGLRETDH